MEFIKQLKEEHRDLNGGSKEELCVVATGGGAYKYYDKLKETLNVGIMREDEMECLITGTISRREIAKADQADLLCSRS